MDMTPAHHRPSAVANGGSLFEPTGEERRFRARRELLSRPLSSIPPWHPDTVLLLSESGVYLDYHAADHSQLPIAPKSLLKRHVTEVLPPNVARLFFDALAQTRHSRSPVELEYALKAGAEERHYEARFIAVPREQVVCIVRDVTPRVRMTAMSQEIERLRSDLAHASRVGLMGRLAASLVHELNQPLTTVLANANAARRFLSSNTDQARQQLPGILADIAGGAERARQLIARHLSLARKGASDPQSLDMNSVVEDIALVARPELAFRRVSFELRLARKELPVFADRVQMQQVVLNLILNAVDSAARRASNRPLVLLRTRSRHPHAVVEVEDNGAGIDRKDLPRLFDPFFSTKKQGMGLGLTIAAEIVRAHGGKITATARKGGGAIFRIALPLARSSGRRRPSPSPDPRRAPLTLVRPSELHLDIAKQLAASRRLGAEVLVEELATAMTLLDAATKSKAPAALRRAAAIAVGMLDFAARIQPRVDLSPANRQRLDKLRMQLQSRLRDLNAPGSPAR